MKKIALILLLTITNLSQALPPENMPESVYQSIVAQVIADKGHFDVIAVEQGINQWLLDQPLANTDGELLDSGPCTDCSADNQGTDSQFNQPRRIRIKAKQRPNGDYPTVLKIKWKKPKKLNASLNYELSHYLVHISKDGSSYEVLKVTPKFKRNGRLKKNQRIRFKDRATGDYQVQVSAVYIPKGTRSTSKSLAGSKAISQQKVVGATQSPWTTGSGFTTAADPTTVAELTGNLRTCLLAGGYTDATLLLDITKEANCANQNIVDADIAEFQLLLNVRNIDLSDNPALTDISGLNSLNYL